MSLNAEVASFSAPLSLVWRRDESLAHAVPGDGVLYGIKETGRLAAFSAADGSQRWESAGTYLKQHLVRQGSRLFAYKLNEGLGYIDDQGSSATEHLAVSFRATATENIAAPVLDQRRIYLLVNRGLYVVDQDQGLQYADVLNNMQPYGIGLIAERDIVLIDGTGVPSRYRVGQQALERIWAGSPHGIDAGQIERPFVIANNRLIIGVNSYTVAYDLGTGQIAWILPNSPAQALAVHGDVVYTAFHGAALSAIQAADGALLWHRQYLYDTSLQLQYGVASTTQHVYFGGKLRTNPDGAVLLAVNKGDGSFAWISRAAALPWAGGIPCVDNDHVYVYGGPHTGAYVPLTSAPAIQPDHLQASPRPLRGPTSSFGSGQVAVNLPVTARVSIAPYREREGLAALLVNRANWAAGNHQANWSPGGSGGYTSANQFGYMLYDVEESSGLRYTQALLVPVNTFPDIARHWAQGNIEVMAYHRYVNGYLDQLFKPNNLVTRAESSTIIAKTLALEAPGAGFRTRFTDIATHWARLHIMALEEKGIIGGFAEPDGTFTFRPDLNMTRGQEARILVRAYSIPAAPADFASRFADISGHWAEGDIRAMESAGYVNGFPEADGSFTFRPEQNLTRAEMCTVIVRIRNLVR